MSKTISSAHLAALQSEVTTECTCWEIHRQDGQSFYFTDHDGDLIFDSGAGTHTYISAVGYTRSALTANSDMSTDNIEFQGIFDDASITNLDLQSGLFDFAEVQVLLVNWADMTMAPVKLRKGNLGDVQGTPSGVFTTQLNGLVSTLSHVVGDLYSATCRVDLFSTGFAQCNASSTGFIKTAVVASVTDQLNFHITVTEPRAVDGWFVDGIVSFTDGNNSGRRTEVKGWVQSSSLVTLFLPMPKPIQVGDTLTIAPGCDKTLLGINGCKLKFNNVVNRQAEDYVPGDLFIVQGPAQQQ